MKLKQAKGNTWYLEDWQLIPLYKLDQHRCILLDTGLYEQRQEIEDTLLGAGLTPVGIIGTHSHNDHSSNHHYFQQKYRIPVALSMGEAAVCCSKETLKAHFFMNSISEFMSNERVSHMLVRADRIIWPEDQEFELCGVNFGILHTPGHSVDHIAIRTPDGVLYLGDALLTGAELRAARFPYHFCFEAAVQTLERLSAQRADLFLAAHKGIYGDLGDLPEQNIRLINSRAEGILKLLDKPLSFSELSMRVCAIFRLRSSARGAVALYERNIHSYLEYLKDMGRVETLTRDGIFYYQKSESNQG